MNVLRTSSTRPSFPDKNESDLESFIASVPSLDLCIGREQELPAHIEDMAAQCRRDETEIHQMGLEIEASIQQLCTGLKECVEVLVFLMQKFKLDQHAVSLRYPFQCNVCKFAMK